MRFFILSIVCFILISTKSTAQINDLSDLSTGEFMSFKALFDYDDNLFGYVAQFSLGETEKRINTFEFIVYDKNLNRLFFDQVSGDNLVEKYNFHLNKKQELIITPDVNLANIGLFQAIGMMKSGVHNKVYKLNLNSGIISNIDPPCYFVGELMNDCLNMDNGTMNKKIKAHKKKIGFFEQGVAEELDDNNFLVRTRRTKNYKNYTDFQIKFFDENKKELWSYEYNVKSKRKKYEEVQILDYSEKN